MTDVNLKFDVPSSTSHPVDLVFGTQYITFSESKLRLQSTIPAPKITASIKYDNAVYRGPSSGVGSKFSIADRSLSVVSDVMTTPLRNESSSECDWEESTICSSITSVLLADAKRTQSSDKSGWSDGIVSEASTESGFSDMIRSERLSVRALNSIGICTNSISKSSYIDLYRFPRPKVLSGWSDGVLVNSRFTSDAGVAKPFSPDVQSYWQSSRKPQPDKHVPPIIVPPGNPCYVPPVGSNVELKFIDLVSTGTDLLFKCENYVPTPGAAIIVPVKATYMITNQISLKRVDTGAQMDPLTLSMTIDKTSWTWGFSTTLPASALSIVSPDQFGNAVTLEATINGVPYRFIAESIKRDRSFGKSSISVTGRGQSAVLSDPYSGVMTFGNPESRTAQQLMADVLTENGVNIGWDVEWNIDDWVVPSGAWAHRGTRMSAITTIAAAAGAFIQPHNTLKKLLVLPNTPVAPWNLASSPVDIELPADPIIQESVAWENRAEYDSVYVSGTSIGGILGQVKRTGSAGSKSAPMVTDSLITDVIAARQRGIYELSKFGRVIKYQLNLPILQETGIIMPGKTVRYVDNGISNTGTVDSVQANVSLPNASQTITLTSYV